MKKRITAAFLLLCIVALFAGCNGASSKTIIEMELTKDYDEADPFIHEKLFYVNKNTDNLKLDVAFEMVGDSGLLEIADSDTNHIYWNKSWSKTVTATSFSIPLDNLEAEKDYVIRFTGTKIDHAKIVVTSDSSLVKERERPLKPSKSPK